MDPQHRFRSPSTIYWTGRLLEVAAVTPTRPRPAAALTGVRSCRAASRAGPAADRASRGYDVAPHWRWISSRWTIPSCRFPSCASSALSGGCRHRLISSTRRRRDSIRRRRRQRKALRVRADRHSPPCSISCSTLSAAIPRRRCRPGDSWKRSTFAGSAVWPATTRLST